VERLVFAVFDFFHHPDIAPKKFLGRSIECRDFGVLVLILTFTYSASNYASTSTSPSASNDLFLHQHQHLASTILVLGSLTILKVHVKWMAARGYNKATFTYNVLFHTHLCLVKIGVDRSKRLDSSIAVISCAKCYSQVMSVEKSFIVEALSIGTSVVIQILDRISTFHLMGGRFRVAPDLAEIVEFDARRTAVESRFGELDRTIADYATVKELSDLQRALLVAYIQFIGSFLDWQRRHWGGK